MHCIWRRFEGRGAVVAEHARFIAEGGRVVLPGAHLGRMRRLGREAVGQAVGHVAQFDAAEQQRLGQQLVRRGQDSAERGDIVVVARRLLLWGRGGKQRLLLLLLLMMVVAEEVLNVDDGRGLWHGQLAQTDWDGIGRTQHTHD